MKYKKIVPKVKKTRAKRKPVLTALKKLIRKEIHRSDENKYANITSKDNNVVSYYVASNSLFCVSCIPFNAITQGVGQGSRIGNEISIRKLMFNYVIRPAPYDVTNNAFPKSQIVMLFFGKVKNSKPALPDNADWVNIWQTGNTVNAPYSTTLDAIATINKEWFTIYKIVTHKIGYSATTALSGSNTAYEYYQNNDYKFNVVRKLDITKYAPKKLLFNDAATTPTNDGLYMWAMSVNADGSQRNTVNQSITTYMDYNCTITYEDA